MKAARTKRPLPNKLELAEWIRAESFKACVMCLQCFQLGTWYQKKRILLLGKGQPEVRKVNPSLPQHCQMDQNEEGGNSPVVTLRSRAPKQQ